MQSLRNHRRRCMLHLIVLLLISGLFAQTASAGIVGTEIALGGPEFTEQERLQAVIDRDDVRERLIARGVDPAHAMDRAASLSDAEAAEMNAQIDALPAGAAGTVTILLVVIILLLILR